MVDRLKREKIEADILDKAFQIKWRRGDPGWVEEKEIDEFLASWQNLVDYYRQDIEGPVDKDIGVFMIRLILDYTYALEEVKSKGDHEAHYREEADIAIQFLRYYIDEIIKTVESNVNNA